MGVILDKLKEKRMPRPKALQYIITQVVVSIPRAGEFTINLPVPFDAFLDPPTSDELLAVVADDVHDRLRIKLAKGEHKHFVKTWKKTK